jgi:hypothetical protein
MPEANVLPDDIKLLSRRQAFELTHRRFKEDCNDLIGVIKKSFQPPGQEKPKKEPVRDLVKDIVEPLIKESVKERKKAPVVELKAVPASPKTQKAPKHEKIENIALLDEFLDKLPSDIKQNVSSKPDLANLSEEELKKFVQRICTWKVKVPEKGVIKMSHPNKTINWIFFGIFGFLAFMALHDIIIGAPLAEGAWVALVIFGFLFLYKMSTLVPIKLNLNTGDIESLNQTYKLTDTSYIEKNRSSWTGLSTWKIHILKHTEGKGVKAVIGTQALNLFRVPDLKDTNVIEFIALLRRYGLLNDRVKIKH